MLLHMQVNPWALACLGLALFTTAGTAAAAVQCPAVSAGRPLRVTDGGTLYLGRVQDKMLSSPDGTQQGPNGSVNTWRFRHAEDYTLVCRYDGTQAVVSFPLTSEIKVCRQEARIRSFVCQ